MSLILEKKAQELFNQYMQAELIGNDALADSIEKQLNSGNWYITEGPDGPTIRKKETDFGGITEITDKFAPKDPEIAPSPPTDNPNRNMWIGIGIGLGILALIVAIIIIIKRRKNAKLATQLANAR